MYESLITFHFTPVGGAAFLLLLGGTAVPFWDEMKRNHKLNCIVLKIVKCGTTVQNASLRMQMVFSELVKSEDWNRRADGTKKPSRRQMGQQTDQKSEWIRSQSCHCHMKEHESTGEESPSKTE